jgi:hypothetical protein
MMFSGTYPTEFYRTVRDLLHDQVAERTPADLQMRWADLAILEERLRQAAPPAALQIPSARLTVSAAADG